MKELIRQSHLLIDALIDAPPLIDPALPEHKDDMERALDRARECYDWLLKAYGLMPPPPTGD